MKVYFADFQGMWNTGTAVIVARSKPQALKQINDEIQLLKDNGILGADRMRFATIDGVVEVDTHRSSCLIINNGDE